MINEVILAIWYLFILTFSIIKMQRFMLPVANGTFEMIHIVSFVSVQDLLYWNCFRVDRHIHDKFVCKNFDIV